MWKMKRDKEEISEIEKMSGIYIVREGERDNEWDGERERERGKMNEMKKHPGTWGEREEQMGEIERRLGMWNKKKELVSESKKN